MYNKKVGLLGCKPLSIGHKWWRSVLIGQRPLWCPSFTKGSCNVHVIVTMTTEAFLRARTGLHFLSLWLVRLDARTKNKSLFFYKSSDPLYTTAVICVVWPLWTMYCVVLSEVIQWKSVHIYENTQSNILYDVCVFASEPEIWRVTLSSGIRWPQLVDTWKSPLFKLKTMKMYMLACSKGLFLLYHWQWKGSFYRSHFLKSIVQIVRSYFSNNIIGF